MNLMPGTQQFVGNNPLAVGRSGLPVRVFSVEVISGGTASTVILYNSTTNASNTNYSQVDGTASQSVIKNYNGGKLFPNGCYLLTDANSAFVTVTFTTEN
jgi:hypothetical protein